MTTLILLWLVGGTTPHSIKIEGFGSRKLCAAEGYRWKISDAGRSYFCVTIRKEVQKKPDDIDAVLEAVGVSVELGEKN